MRDYNHPECGNVSNGDTMRTAHKNHLEAIRTASKEKPYTVDYDFIDFVKNEYPSMYHMIEKDMQDKICIVLPAGFKLTAEV